MSIPNLQNLLIKILRDYESQVQMQQECLSATIADSDSLLLKHLIICASPSEISETSLCSVCKYDFIGITIFNKNFIVNQFCFVFCMNLNI